MASFQVADGLATAIYNKIKTTICNLIYPVGSIKMTVTNTNPSTYLGGTWSLWGAGKVPVGIDTSDSDFKTVEKTGGSKSHYHGDGATRNGSLTAIIGASHSDPSRIAYKHTNDYVGNTNTTTYSVKGNYADTGGNFNHHTQVWGNTTNATTLQPYITCYMWKRTA